MVICIFMTHDLDYLCFIVDLLVIVFDVLHIVFELLLMLVTVFQLPSSN